MKKLMLFTVLFSLLISCTEGENQTTLPRSNGTLNQVLVVMQNDLWQGKEGDELRKVTGDEVLGLPQREPQFRVTQIPTNSFKNLFHSQRNVLIASLGKTTGFSAKTNVYATPQTLIRLTATDNESLIKLIAEKKSEITSIFKNADLKSLQRKLRKSQFDNTKLKTLENLNISLEIPSEYKLVDDTGDFLWMRKHLRQGQMNLIVYELPINSIEDEEGQNIVSVRDTIGKKYVPGPTDGSFMITERAYSPHTFSITLDDKKAFETRGKWDIINYYFMAGPFLNYTIVDKANNRLVVVEGFTYSPTTNKRDFMFELEAVLKTLKIK